VADAGKVFPMKNIPIYKQVRIPGGKVRGDFCPDQPEKSDNLE
jgi:hypothetical protein